MKSPPYFSICSAVFLPLERSTLQRPLALMQAVCARAVRSESYGFAELLIALRQLHAAWVLLSLESGTRLAACDFRRADCIGLSFDTDHASVFRAEEARTAV